MVLQATWEGGRDGWREGERADTGVISNALLAYKIMGLKGGIDSRREGREGEKEGKRSMYFPTVLADRKGGREREKDGGA